MFEQNALGRIDDKTFADLYNGYQEEQKALAERLREIEDKQILNRNTEANAKRFTTVVAKYTDATDLTKEMLRDLIEKIVVHEARGSKGSKRVQEVEIHFRFIGCLPERIAKDELSLKTS